MDTEVINDNVLYEVPFHKRCQHNKFIVDETLDQVTCGICNKALNPIWVLKQFATKEHRAAERMRYLLETMEKTKEKLRCKCKHCGRITPIAR